MPFASAPVRSNISFRCSLVVLLTGDVVALFWGGRGVTGVRADSHSGQAAVA